MCGIAGFSGKQNMNEADLKILLYFAEERGDDACGVATPNDILKKAESPHDFINRPLPVGKTVLGHTRGSTTGANTDENAHPFKNGDLVGTHNGIIRNFDDLQESEGTDFNVDSEIIWHLINKYGIEDALPMMNGWMALAWLDEDNNLNLYRSTAPLNIGWLGDDLYYASQERYLEAIDCTDIQSIEYWNQYIISEGEIINQIDLSGNTPKRNTNSSGQTLGVVQRAKQKAKGFSSITKNDNIPEMAERIDPENLHGIELYYWFGTNTNVLYVQPVAEAMKNYLPDLDYFTLTDEKDIIRLERSYPDIMNVREVYTKIPAFSQ